MRIALIGPTHPYKGGIALHTTQLAHELKKSGHDVHLISWSAQYPSILYPGEQRVPDDKPELPVFGETSYPLSWKAPAGWVKVGRQLRRYDAVVLVFVTSIQAPAYLAMLTSLGQRHRGKVIALCHNVLPHERRFFDVPFTKAVLRRVGRVLVHTDAQAKVARQLTPAQVIVAEMPPHFPGKPQEARNKELKHSLLFFGLVRKYKGVDILLQALAKVPGVHLTIAGEVWGGAESYQQLIAKLGLTDRVKLLAGYVPSEEIPRLFGEADALVLPYRSGTGTQNISLAFAHGIPVIASKVGSMAHQLKDNVDGLFCKPDDVQSLVQAIQKFYEAGVAERLRRGVPKISTETEWAAYTEALLSTIPQAVTGGNRRK